MSLWFIFITLSPLFRLCLLFLISHSLPHSHHLYGLVPATVFTHCLPQARKIQHHLLPPLLGYLLALPLFSLQTKVKIRPCRNVLRERIIMLRDVGLHLFQTKRLHCIFQWGVNPAYFCRYPQFLPWNPSFHPAV